MEYLNGHFKLKLAIISLIIVISCCGIVFVGTNVFSYENTSVNSAINVTYDVHYSWSGVPDDIYIDGGSLLGVEVGSSVGTATADYFNFYYGTNKPVGRCTPDTGYRIKNFVVWVGTKSKCYYLCYADESSQYPNGVSANRDGTNKTNRLYYSVEEIDPDYSTRQGAGKEITITVNVDSIMGD